MFPKQLLWKHKKIAHKEKNISANQESKNK